MVTAAPLGEFLTQAPISIPKPRNMQCAADIQALSGTLTSGVTWTHCEAVCLL